MIWGGVSRRNKYNLDFTIETFKVQAGHSTGWHLGKRYCILDMVDLEI